MCLCLILVRGLLSDLLQIAKMGGEQMQHLNNSSPVVDASLYGYGGQKRSLDEGGTGGGLIVNMSFVTSVRSATADVENQCRTL